MLSKKFNEYVKDEKEFMNKNQVFLITGQFFSDLMYPSELGSRPIRDNDLDVFVFVDEYMNHKEQRSSANQDEYIELNQSQNYKIYDVSDEETGTKVAFKQFIYYVPLQYIDTKNVYTEIAYQENSNESLMKSAYKLLNDFYIQDVKIGLLTDKDFNSISLIVHEDYLDNLETMCGLPTPANCLISTIFKSVMKFNDYHDQNELPSAKATGFPIMNRM